MNSSFFGIKLMILYDAVPESGLNDVLDKDQPEADISGNNSHCACSRVN